MMRKTVKNKIITALAAAIIMVACVSSVGFFHNTANAVEPTNYNLSYVKKALLAGVWQCYTNNSMKSELVLDKVEDFRSFGEMIQQTKPVSIALPKGLTPINDSNISCYGLFMGDKVGSGESGSFEGMFSLAQLSPTPSSRDAKVALLENMGYNAYDKVLQNGKCISFTFHESINNLSLPDGATNKTAQRDITTDQICAIMNSEGIIEKATIDTSTATYSSGTDTSLRERGGQDFFKISGDVVKMARCSGTNENCTSIRDTGVKFKGKTWDQFSEELRRAISAVADDPNNALFWRQTSFGYTSPLSFTYVLQGNSIADGKADDNIVGVEFKLKDPQSASYLAIKTLSKGQFNNGPSDLVFSKQDQVSFYVQSINNYFFRKTSNTSDYWICNQPNWNDKAAFNAEVHVGSDAQPGDCRINTNKAPSGETIYGIRSDGIFDATGGTTLTLQQTIDKINSLVAAIEKEEEEKRKEQIEFCKKRAEDKIAELEWSKVGIWSEDDRYKQIELNIETVEDMLAQRNGKNYYEEKSDGTITCAALPGEDSYDGPVYVPSEIKDPSKEEGGDDDDDNNNSSNSDQPLCFEAAETLGWILCPVLEFVSDTSGKIYSYMIEPLLSVNVSLIADNADGSIHGGWSNFRNFANTLFAIAFVIVILAQITGIGISNYNIKKILPRLIMVVVLVNLSFIICQLAVDVSNILGKGLKDLFSGLAADASTTYNSLTEAITGVLFSPRKASGVAADTAVVTGAGAAIVAAVLSWDTWIFPLIFALIGCLIGILFFFVVIGVRQAGIIILVVLSPIAIICYALPNTKAFFDRWRKMFTSLLLVYPICGLLIGGGQYAATLIIKSDVGENNFWLVLAGMLVQIVPFFMIPSIVKNSMTMMGNLGNKIAGFGQRFSGRMTGAMAKSRWVQDRQQEMTRANTSARDRRIALSNQSIAQSLKDKQERGETLTAREKRRLRMAEYRLGRARTRYEGTQAEDARNSAGADRELLEPGSARHANMMASLQNDVIEAEAKDRARALMDDTNFDSTSTDPDSDLAKEHSAALDAVLSNPTSTTAQARLRAVEQLLMAQKDHGYDVINSNYNKLESRYDELRRKGTANNATAEDRKSLSTFEAGIRNASGHLAQNYAGDLKTYGGKSALARFQNMSNLRNGNMTSLMANVDGDAGSMNEGSLNDFSESWFKDNLEAIQSGRMSADNLNNLVKVLRRYETNNNIVHKASVQKDIDKLLDAAYSSSISTDSVTRNADGTDGYRTVNNLGSGASVASGLIGQASAGELSGISQILDSIANYDTTLADDSPAARRQNKVARQIANIQYAYNNSDGKLTQEQAIEMEHILKTAQAKGFAQANTVNGNNVGFALDPNTGHLKIADLAGMTFKVAQGQKPATEHIDMPQNWENIDGVWYDTGNLQKLSAADAAYADELVRNNAQARLDVERQKRARDRRASGSGNP